MKSNIHEIRITKTEADWIMEGYYNTFAPVPGEHYNIGDICMFVVTDDEFHYLHHTYTYITKVEDRHIAFEPVARPKDSPKWNICIIGLLQAYKINSGACNYFIADSDGYTKGQLIQFMVSGDSKDPLNGRRAFVTDVYELYNGEVIVSFNLLMREYHDHNLGEVLAILQPPEFPAYVTKDGTVHFASLGDWLKIDGVVYLYIDGKWVDEQYQVIDRPVWSRRTL